MIKNRHGFARVLPNIDPLVDKSTSSSKKVKEGDFVSISYIGFLEGTKEVVDTNIEQVAKDFRIYRQDFVYSPRLIVVGNDHLFPAMDKEIIGKKEGSVFSFSSTYIDLYGPSDTSFIKFENRKEFQRLEVKPRKGLCVYLRDREGVVEYVSSDKIRVNYNHPLSSKNLDYTVKIVSIQKTKEEICKSIVHHFLHELNDDSFSLTFLDDVLEIRLSVDTRYLMTIQFDKTNIADLILKHLLFIKKVVFIEEITSNDVPNLPNSIKRKEGAVIIGDGTELPNRDLFTDTL